MDLEGVEKEKEMKSERRHGRWVAESERERVK